jgi:WD40 repeat protein
VIINDEKDLFFLKMKTFKNDRVEFDLVEELAGCNDLVMDLRFMKMKNLDDARNDLLIVASNSDKLRIVNLQNKSNMFAVSHTDMIMCLDTREEFILTGSKDTTIKMWRVDIAETTVDFCLFCRVLNSK